jgi:tetratricopeptide (TPR) repeat protein
VLGRLPEAEAALGQALAIAERAGQQRRAGHAFAGLAALASDRGDLASALDPQERVLALRRSAGSGFDLQVALANLALTLHRSDRPARARAVLLEAWRLHGSVGSGLTAQYLVDCAELLLGGAGTRPGAASRGLRRESQQPLEPAGPQGMHRQLQRLRQALGDERFEAAWREGRAWSPDEAVEAATAALAATPA